MGGGTERDDWTDGPAKWAAVIVLAIASAAGLAWAVLRPVGPPVVRAAAEPRPAPVDESETLDGSRPVPTSGRAETPAASADAPTPAKPAFSGTLNINTASAAELEALPGIGPALAGRIIDDRAANGPFRTVDDLDRVRGIGPKTLERLRPYLRVQ